MEILPGVGNSWYSSVARRNSARLSAAVAVVWGMGVSPVANRMTKRPASGRRYGSEIVDRAGWHARSRQVGPCDKGVGRAAGCITLKPAPAWPALRAGQFVSLLAQSRALDAVRP